MKSILQSIFLVYILIIPLTCFEPPPMSEEDCRKEAIKEATFYFALPAGGAGAIAPEHYATFYVISYAICMSDVK